MIVRKAANDAGNLAVFSHMEEEGVELLLVSAHKGARPLCSLDQGRVFSLKGFEGTVKDGEGNSIRVRSWASSTYGHPAGILGINCRHHIVPFYEGRSVNTQERPDDEENAKQYKLEQEQRRREHELRKHKRMRDVANAMGDREEELRQKRIIRQKGRSLRKFIGENDLTRNELRERNMTKVELDHLQERLDFIDPYTNEKSFIPNNTVIETSKTIVRGMNIRTVDKIVDKFGGDPNKWDKKVGKIESAKYIHDVHWYDYEGKQYDMKVKWRGEKS